MRQRALGRSGIMVGEVGLGCEGLIGKNDEYVKTALDMMEAAGANAIDLYSPNPDMRDALGGAMRGRREKFVLQGHICSIWQNGQYKRARDIAETKAAFKDQLRRLRTDYIDVGMIHYVDAETDWQGIDSGPIMEYANDLKRRGVIKAIGLSSHNPEVALQAIEGGDVGVLLFSINPCYDLQPGTDNVEDLWKRERYAGQLVNMDPQRMALYESCQRLGVGVTVMKAFGGGDLLKAEQSLAGVALTCGQCIAYALDRPGVACVLAGARDLDELAASLDFAKLSSEERDYAKALADFPRVSWKGHCMYCGHCAPCPAGIDVAAVTKFLNLAQGREETPETVAGHYDSLPHKAHECVKCGKCEDRCPFEVKVRENMESALEIFGS